MSRLAALAFLCLFASASSAFAQPADPQNTIILETTKGKVVIRLRTDLAPKHAERLKQLARDKYYDNVPFHRVIPGFMAQTGDGQRGDGTGGSKYPDLKAEFTSTPFVRGVVGMARSQSPNSANSQFFIMFGPTPSLDGQYTVIGQVTSGMENVDKLKKGSEANNGSVSSPDKILTARVAADKQ
jgi:peptidylprolyl isomerase